MQFSDPSTKQGILQQINFYCNLNPDDTTDFPTADKVREANNAYRDVLAAIWRVQGEWVFDDSNLTTIPYFKTNLVENQIDYANPAGCGPIDRVEVKNSNGIWVPLTRVTRKQMGGIAVEEYRKSAGVPCEVEFFANSYRLYPKSNRTSTDGDSLRVYAARDISPFTASDTTKEPGFHPNFHKIIAIIPAIIYAIKNGERTRKNDLEALKAEIMEGIENYYSNRQTLDNRRATPKNRQRFAR